MKAISAAFNPASFKLPDSLQNILGPDIQDLPPNPEVQAAERDVALAANAPQAAPQVQENLERKLKSNQQTVRSDALKAVLMNLKALRGNDPSTPAFREALLRAIAQVKSCYGSDHAPKDLETMGVLFPLLKCQEYKWEALKARQQVTPPPPEAGLLKKWRSLNSPSVSAVEKATLYQIVMGLNALCERCPADVPANTQAAPEAPAQQPVQQASPDTPPRPAPVETATEPEEPEEPFDPMTSGRRLLQLRARIQRACSEREKEGLQKQLQSLLQQQSAYYAQRRQAVLKEAQTRYALLIEHCQKSPRPAQVQQWRQQLVKQLEYLQRLYGQDKAQSRGPDLFAAAIRQLARLGMDDAQQIQAQEQAKIEAIFADFSEPECGRLKQWNTLYQKLLDAFSQTLKQLVFTQRVALAKELLKEISAAQDQLQVQQDQIRTWEQELASEADAGRCAELRQKLLSAYAELIVELPVWETEA